MRTVQVLVVIVAQLLFAAAGCCRTPPKDPAKAEGEEAVAKMMQAYGALAEYEDTGDASGVSADGSAHTITFSTRFSRAAGGLRFAFRIPSVADPSQGHNGLLLAQNGSETLVSVEGHDEKPATRSLEGGTGELQGLTNLSSIFVPRLIYRQLFCSCASPAEVVVEGRNTIDGRDCVRIRFVSPARNTFLLWIDRETSLLKRVEVQFSNQDQEPARSVVRYRVAQAR